MGLSCTEFVCLGSVVVSSLTKTSHKKHKTEQKKDKSRAPVDSIDILLVRGLSHAGAPATGRALAPALAPGLGHQADGLNVRRALAPDAHQLFRVHVVQGVASSSEKTEQISINPVPPSHNGQL